MRKIIQLSPSTHVVSLPSAWIRRQQLRKGDEVAVQELEDQVIVTARTREKKDSTTIDLRKLPDKLVWAVCDAAYIAGHHAITFLHTPKQAAILRYVQQEVPGMLITSQRQESITFTDITAGKAEEVQAIIVRVLHMISDLISEASSHAKSKAWTQLQEMKRQDHVINSYVSYAQRQINRFGFEKTYSSNLIITYLKLCETFADIICKLCKVYAARKKDISKGLSTVLEAWRSTVALFLGYSDKNLIACEAQRRKISKGLFSTHEAEQLATSLFDIMEVVIQSRMR